MGWWVLVTACRQAKAWQQVWHPDLTVAVNVAARQFHDPSFLRRVTDVLAETGLRPSSLELEITETQAMQNPEATSRVLTEISGLGVRISIDDFGTGYSSLSYLTRLPIHALKVDRSFVQGIATGACDAAVATAIIQLAHTLNLSVQAEGVETREQLDILSLQSCDRVQGFFYSRPLGVAECEAFLVQHRTPSQPRQDLDLVPQPEAGPDSRGQAWGKRRSIVMIEDSDDVREGIEMVLTGAGYRVVGTGDPRRALELVRHHRPDLVLCDIAMPEIDGYDVVRTLQGDPTTARFPVVFLTGSHELTERVRAFRFGVVDYLTKPIEPNEFTEKIAGILNGIDRRSGAVEAGRGASAQEIVVEVQRAGRTGLLTMRGGSAYSRIVLRGGAVVGQTGEAAAPIRTHFEEIDPRLEQIVTSEPDPLLIGGDLPTFDDIPPGLREALIADHSPSARGFLRGVLEARGFLVHEAGSGEEAVRMALRRPPQIALLDVRVEGLDGFEVRRLLRTHHATRNVPIVFLSGSETHDEQDRGNEAGAEPEVSRGSSVHDILGRMEFLMKRYGQAGTAGRGGAGMEGDVGVIGASGLLHMCYRGRLTGVLKATHEGQTVSMAFEIGWLASALSDGAQGREAILQFLAWTEGRFVFRPGAIMAGGPISEPTDFLILDACRVLDQRAAAKLAN
jgi:EAL domain-containing protein (putative c-di-GMP-specific phosphodiesterase class I)/CheY-like chemotaxis protein